MTTASVRLPRPAFAAVIDETVALVTSIGDRVPRGHMPDPTLHPRRFSVMWQAPFGAVADAVRRAFEDNPYDVFLVDLPTFGEVQVIWGTPPTTQWGSWTSASTITAELEEAIAHT